MIAVFINSIWTLWEVSKKFKMVTILMIGAWVLVIVLQDQIFRSNQPKSVIGNISTSYNGIRTSASGLQPSSSQPSPTLNPVVIKPSISSEDAVINTPENEQSGFAKVKKK